MKEYSKSKSYILVCGVPVVLHYCVVLRVPLRQKILLVDTIELFSYTLWQGRQGAPFEVFSRLFKHSENPFFAVPSALLLFFG
jgi:hypothetical protein